jgi:hypothetical protein
MKKKVIKKKVKKIKKVVKKETKEQILRKRVNSLSTKLKINIDKFQKKHQVFLFCYPQGGSHSGIPKKNCFQQNIYLCKTICNNKCDSYLRQAYICKDIQCTHHSICLSKSKKEMLRYCKRRNLLTERKHLIKLYKKYFYVMSIFRGLKLDPVQTIKYLDQKKKKR